MTMKPPKKPSQESPLPSQDESRRSNVLMEQMLSKFNTFGEVQSHMLERIDRIEPRFDKLEQKVDVLELAVRTNGKDIAALKETVHTMHSDLKDINQRLVIVETNLP